MAIDFREDIKRACDILKKGGVILYPTDTVWGLGCDATNSDAVNRVFKIKQRIDSKAMIVLLGSDNEIQRYVKEVPEIAYDLVALSVKPLTIVYDKGIYLAPELLAEDGSVGIRVTKEQFSMSLCKAFRRPIVSTSANISGKLTPAFFDEISDEIKAQVDYIVETRRDERIKHKPSSVIKLDCDGTVKILRN